MSDIGLTDQGFNRRRLQDIRQLINTTLRDKLGAINLEGDSVIGQLVGITANRFSELWQNLENVYVSQYIDFAEGSSLDDLVALLGITRLQPLNTQAFIEFFSTTSTLINQGTEVATTADDIFIVASDFTIATANASNVTVEVSNVQDTTTYTITIDSTDYEVTSSGSATANGILTLLETELNNASIDNTLDTTNETLQILLDENKTFQLSSNLSYTEFGTLQQVPSEDTGVIDSPTGSITEIITPVANLTRVNNRFESIEGRNLESDTDLRERVKANLDSQSTATRTAIVNALLAVDGVLFADAFANRTDAEVSGRPPKSVEAVVLGGSDADVAQALFESVADGIQYAGDETETVTTDSGQQIAIKFSRPENVYIFIDVDLTTNSSFPANGNDLVQTNLFNFGQNLTLGEDIIWQSFFEAIYEVAGITNADLTFASSNDPNTPGSYSAANITIGDTQLSIFSEDRIDVSN